jgi:hypothetical protein
MLIQYNDSWQAYLEAVSSSHDARTCLVVKTETHLTWRNYKTAVYGPTSAIVSKVNNLVTYVRALIGYQYLEHCPDLVTY